MKLISRPGVKLKNIILEASQIVINGNAIQNYPQPVDHTSHVLRHSPMNFEYFKKFTETRKYSYVRIT